MEAPWIGMCEEDYRGLKDFEFTVTVRVTVLGKDRDHAREILENTLDCTVIDGATDTQIED